MGQADLMTGLDIAYACLTDGGETASLTGDYGVDVQRFIREVYWALLATERWPWALSPTPGIITTKAKQDMVVASISAADPAIVTLSATLAASQAGRKFYLDANQSVYRIAAHTAGTALLTLDAPYVETETAGPGVIFQDEYNLPSTMLKVWDPLNIRGQLGGPPIQLMEKPLFEARYGRGTWGVGFGPIEAACEIQPDAYSASANGVIRRLRLAPWSENALNLEFDYSVFHNLDFSGSGDSDTPRIPREYRNALLYGANFRLWGAKDDLKQASIFGTLYDGTVQQMRTLYLPQQHSRAHVQLKHSAALGCT